MSDAARIEWQDIQGRWHVSVTTLNAPTIIKSRFEQILKAQPNAAKVRAVDAKTGSFIDMQQR